MKSIYSFTYLNSKDGTFSIQSRQGWNYGCVADRGYIVEVKNVIFKISEAGRQRVLREGVKNVHAGLLGQAVSKNGLRPSLRGYTRVRYNPYTSNCFVEAENGKPVVACSKAILMDRTIYAKGLRYGTE